MLAGRAVRRHVQGQRDSRAAESAAAGRRRASPGPAAAFLGRLEHGDDRASPGVAVTGEIPQRSDEVRHVHVVAAGVHDAHDRPACIGHLHLRGVVEPRLLDHRQRVHVGPQQQRRAVAVLQHAHDAVAADVLGHLQPESPHLRRHLGGGLLLFVRQLGRLVQVLVKLGKRRQARPSPTPRAVPRTPRERKLGKPAKLQRPLTSSVPLPVRGKVGGAVMPQTIGVHPARRFA